MDFVAIDFETANADMASICQVGVAEFRGGQMVSGFSSLVDPEDFFDDINISVHGIDEDAVVGAPTWPEVYPKFKDMISAKIVVSHTPFDRGALRQAIARYSLPDIPCRWLDSARVVRRAWDEYARSGFGLASMAETLGIEFDHHNACEDARAAGLILVQAIEKTKISIDDWLIRSLRPIGGPIARPGDLDGPLYGEVVVFTGALKIPRREAAEMAARMGCVITGSVTKNTSILVVGDQEISKLCPGETKSKKQRRAESLIASGTKIRIIGESDFFDLCGYVTR